MLLPERIDTFVALGDYLRNPTHQEEVKAVAHQAHQKNNWFTVGNVLNALQALTEQFLTRDTLTDWANRYVVEPADPKWVGVVMAGNLPAVGFQDLLCVLVSGHKLMAKLSSQDFVLIQYLIQKIVELNPAFATRTRVVDRLNEAEAYIATGSDNTSRYFAYYFAKKPHIIRRNRTSLGVLLGDESDEQLTRLGDDILTYYGLGCRNVSTLLIAEEAQEQAIQNLLRTLEPRLPDLLANHKYQNNYDYNKSIYLVNQVPHFDNGFLLLTQNDALVSPISVVYYQTYRYQDDAQTVVRTHADKIQAVASADGWFPGSVPFGQTQRPTLFDYADGVDTMAFLEKL